MKTLETEAPSHPNNMDSDKLSKAIARLAGLVSKLRGPGGCPWDAEQTDSSIKNYLLEEAYEVVEAVETSCPQDVCEELGDLLFQILFLSHLAEERGEFDLVEVLERIETKMIRRHPHVFGDKKVSNSEEVTINWDRIKREEKTASPLDSVPLNLPALQRAHRITERSSQMGLFDDDPDNHLKEMKGAVERLSAAIDEQDGDRFEKQMGELLFASVNMSRKWGFNPENLLREKTASFLNRIGMGSGKADEAKNGPEEGGEGGIKNVQGKGRDLKG